MRPLLSLLSSLALSLTASLAPAKSSLTQQTRSIQTFHSIKVDGPFDVMFSATKTTALTLHADNDILPWIATAVSDDQLVISMKPGIKPHYQQRPQIQLSTQNLSSILVSDHAKMTLSTLQAESLNIGLDDHSEVTASRSTLESNLSIAATNHSSVTISGETKSLLINGTNHCSINADELSTTEATVNLVNHSTAIVSTQQAVVNESNHSVVKLGPETTKIRGHLQNHSRIDAPQSDTTERFISNDAAFG